jgi:hypothetical protein
MAIILSWQFSKILHALASFSPSKTHVKPIHNFPNLTTMKEYKALNNGPP